MQETELQTIRETLGFSRPRFARIIHRSVPMLYLYEIGKSPVPADVISVARAWLSFYNTMEDKWKS